MKEQILFVDDDPNILQAYRRRLQKVVRVETAQGGQEGLKSIREKGPFAVVVADMHMPSMNGIQFLTEVKELAPETVRMMLTGNADLDVATRAVNEGSIFRFLTKPCPADVMGKALVDGIGQYRLIRAEKELLEETLNGTVELLAEILSLADPESFGRAVQLREFAKEMGAELGVESMWEIETGAMLSQIGYVTLPNDLVHKARAGEGLSDEERQLFVRAPEMCNELLERIPRLDPVAKIVLYQRKNYDGTGFPPGGPAQAELPIGARILHVLLDLLDLEAANNTRNQALKAMEQRQGCYDPKVFAAARKLFTKTAKEAGAEMDLTVSIRPASLQVGDKLFDDLKTLDNRLLIRAGEVVTEPTLIRIKNYLRLVGLHEPIRVKRKVAA